MMSSQNGNVIIPVEILLGLVLIRLVLSRGMGDRHLRRPRRPLPQKRLDFLLSRWDAFPQLEGRCLARKSPDPIDPRIAKLQEKFGFDEGEPLTKSNVGLLISNSDYASMVEEQRENARCPNCDSVDVSEKVCGQQNSDYICLDRFKKKIGGQQNGLMNGKYRDLKNYGDFTTEKRKIEKRRLSNVNLPSLENPQKKIKEEAWSFVADCNFKLPNAIRNTL